jgi:hypothetical protein
MPVDEGRYSRNIALFGEEGQNRIDATSVTIVGLGGLGSHVAQQLAHLGVVNFGLIDDDVISTSSLNRVVGATPKNAANGTLKVESARRLITSIQPGATIGVFRGRITRSQEDEAARLVRNGDVVFGCLDAESPRLFLTDLCSSENVPYFDLATDTGGERGDWYGGRVVCCVGNGCLSCLDLIDQRLVRLEQMGEAELAAERRLYGLSGDILGQTGPSVVSVNGVIASMSVTEFMAYVTGTREPATQLTYRGDIPRVTSSADRGREGCPYCSRWHPHRR